MLKILPIEFFLRAIPEAILLILMGYAFDGKSINKRNLCISTILLAIAAYLVRALPIHFGVHTTILIILYVLITVSINKLDVIKSISAVLISATMLFMCEWINVYVLTRLFKFNIEVMFANPYVKVLYGTPSLLLFGFIILIFYKKSYLRKVNKYVFNRENIK